MIPFWLYFVVINLATYLVYWRDKRAARRNDRRVPEFLLLLLGFLGGTIAAFLAQRILRHKNRKQAFQFKFWALTVVQVGLFFFPPMLLKAFVLQLFA